MEIISLLRKYGEVLTEHVGDKILSVMGEDSLTDEYIYNRDMVWLNEADVIVAEVTIPSLGVGYEIGKMEDKKSILCVFREKDEKTISAMIGGNKNIKFKKYKNISELQRIFKDFFANQNI